VPALNIPVEGANQTLDKPGVTLNRAGTNPRNPILKGLGFRVTQQINTRDGLKAVYIYQNRGAIGPSLIGNVQSSAPGIAVLDILAGAGRTVSGTPSTGAIKNFIRWDSQRGRVEKEFFVKTFDYDVVTLNKLPALDPTTLVKVPVVVKQIDASQPWLDVIADWMVSWNDEFQALHVAGNPALDSGFLKSYGGALFISVFDTSTATEGVGTQVNPVTQTPIKDLHKVEVENTAGQKDFTVRFRAKEDSPYFVDVDVAVLVVVDPCEPSDPPDDGGNGEPPPGDPGIDYYVPPPTPGLPPPDFPHYDDGGGLTPGSAAGEDAVQGDGVTPITAQFMLMKVQAATAGADPKLVVRRYSAVSAPSSFGGFKFNFISETEYNPLVIPGATEPSELAVGTPKALRVAFNVASEVTAGVAMYEVQVKDGVLLSQPYAFAGPMFMGGQGFQPGSGTETLTPVV
jgi:hypothetical protein